ncbi:MAG: acyloxyacyl hydrolase [Phycisphaeraceae bacterium]
MQRMWVILAAVLAWGIAGGVGATAQAQTVIDDDADQPGQPVNGMAVDADPFAQGKWTLDIFATVLVDLDNNRDATFYGGGVGVNYYALHGIAIRGEFVGLGVDQQPGSDAAGGGFNLLGRWHFFQQRRFSLFFEGGAGIFQADVSVPDGPRASRLDGTHFNFTLHAGVGATCQLMSNVHLVAAFRYMHLSNAAIEGIRRNPGFDSIGGYVGVMFGF